MKYHCERYKQSHKNHCDDLGYSEQCEYCRWLSFGKITLPKPKEEPKNDTPQMVAQRA